MFTRVVELRCKPGKTNDVCSTANDKVLPILRKQQGFQDELVLVSQTDHNKVLAISFWNRREDAERYHNEQFSRITETIRPLIEGEPQVGNYDVNTSTAHNITLGRAA